MYIESQPLGTNTEPGSSSAPSATERITARTSGLYCYVQAELYDGRSVRLHVTEGRNVAGVI